MWTRAAAVALIAGAPAGAADAPLSAIDWLSRSVEVERDGTVPAVTVKQLSGAPESVGTVSPAAARVPSDIWAGSETGELVALLRQVPGDLPLPLADTLATLALVEAPADDPDGSFLLARIDALLTLGRIEAARQLIEAAGAETPDLFRRKFDTALLTGHENEGCRRLESRPELAPTYPARIFCLARVGDWQAAALTLETAHALDVLTTDEDALLGRFLDDGEAELLPPPKRPETITPLVFRLYEAIGEPLATQRLPIAFAHADLRHLNGWKTRLEAAERLYRAGAIATEDLVALYLEREPAASGGLWDRVAAVQAWDDAGRTPAAADEAAAALVPAGLGRVIGRGDAPPRVAPIDADAAPDRDLAALIAQGRRGEAALGAILRAADVWLGDPDDLSRALAALDAAGVGLAQSGAPQWASNR